MGIRAGQARGLYTIGSSMMRRQPMARGGASVAASLAAEIESRLAPRLELR